MSEKSFQAFKHKLIYIFTIPDKAHKGRLKIGETTFEGNPYDKRSIEKSAKSRIDQYTKTADIKYELLHFDLGITNKGAAFGDHEVHNVLKRSGINPTEGSRGREWFNIDLDTAISAVEAVKEGRKSLGNIKGASGGFNPIVFRPEQEQAITETLQSIKSGKDRKLWNAKMRFGKTVSALELVKRAEFNKTLIITHRPVVSDGWFEDFHKIFRSNYDFGSKTKGETIESLMKKYADIGLEPVHIGEGTYNFKLIDNFLIKKFSKQK